MLTKSSTELVRQQNRALVLGALRRHAALSHTDISIKTALSSGTISAITHELEIERVIERSEQMAGAGRGRPRILFRQRRQAAHAAFVRISSDLVQYSMVDYAGTLIDRFDEKRDDTMADEISFIAALRHGVKRLAGRAGVDACSLMAISVSSKGLVADDRPLLLWSPVLGESRIDFEAALSADWSARITLSNETLLVANALFDKLDQSDDPNVERIAALSLGHSIGLGVVHAQAGQAPRTSAPNFGHMIHVPGGAMCRCGSRGCIEAYAGFYAILRAAFGVPATTAPAKFVPFAEVDKIARQARRGDRRAEFAFRQAGTALGNGLARLLSLHGKMPIIMTGPGIGFYDLMRSGIDEGLLDSLGSKIEGPPEISLSSEEEILVFEGHLQHTLAAIDRDVIAPKPAAPGGEPS